MNISTKRVNGAVAIKLRLMRSDTIHNDPKTRSLRLDLDRLWSQMTDEERHEYQRRIE